MPPIPLHKNDPINPTTAAKPDGITPQTANPPPTRTTPASVPANTTSDPSAPPPPQPGARPLAPTASAQTDSSPPAPQPGASPGYTAHHLTTETRLAGPPPQYHIPPPSDAQLAGRSTTTSTEPSKPGPTTLNVGPAPPGASPSQGEHWGGGLQEVPRSTLEGPPGYVQAPDNTPYAAGGGLGGTQQESGSGADGGVGGAAWNILAKAGEALKKGEEAAWKAVRSNK